MSTEMAKIKLKKAMCELTEFIRDKKEIGVRNAYVYIQDALEELGERR